MQFEIGEKQFSNFGSIWGKNSPLVHVPLLAWVFIYIESSKGSGESTYLLQDAWAKISLYTLANL